MMEKIDFVVPMVFTCDHVWFERFRRESMKAGRIYRNNERVRSWGLERYFFRGLDKFMPWLNKVYVILESETQRPEWMTNVEVVYHRDIMPSHLLPTYNSQTIEMFLGNINGLAEHFIYANDDMVCCSPMKAEDFFKDGLPVIYCRERYVRDGRNIFFSAVKNSMEMAARGTSCTYDEDVLLSDGHSYAPMLLSVVREMMDVYGEEMVESCTKFRHVRNLNQYVYTFRQWMTMRCVDGHHVHHLFSERSDEGEMQRVLRSGNGGVCCFNDDGGRHERFAEAVREELDAVLSGRSKYEK